MKNKASIWCYISGILSYIVGIVYCMSLLFIPIAIYCIIFANRYFKLAKLSDSEYSLSKAVLVAPTIVISIFAFPVGLVTIIPYLMSGANNVKVSKSNFTVPPEGETVKAEVDMVSQNEDNENVEFSVTQADMEKLQKLESFREQGLLSEEEFNQARDQIVNKK